MSAAKKPASVHARYEDYHGKKTFAVQHPKHKTVNVYAPDANSAIVAASKVWRVRWQALDVYAYATATQI